MKNCVYYFPLLLLLALPAAADEQLISSFDEEDVRLINSTNVEYYGCLQQAAAQNIDASNDVREITGMAVNECVGTLIELDNTLAKKGLNPDFYKGMIEQLKSKNIRKLLQVVMMEKAARSSQGN